MSRNLTPALSAFATGRTIAPLWVAPNGREFFPIAGGAPDDPPKNDPPKSDDPPKNDPPKSDEPPKFEPITSQADLDRIVGNRVARERSKYQDYDELREKAAKYDQGVEAAKTEQEKAVDEAKAEGEKTADERWATRVIRSEAKAAAATAKFRDPADAVAFLDLSAIKVDDNGEVDAAALKTLLDDLAAKKPYLLDDGKKPGPRPDPSQGGGGDDDKPSVARGRDRYAERHNKKTS